MNFEVHSILSLLALSCCNDLARIDDCELVQEYRTAYVRIIKEVRDACGDSPCISLLKIRRVIVGAKIILYGISVMREFMSSYEISKISRYCVLCSNGKLIASSFAALVLLSDHENSTMYRGQFCRLSIMRQGAY